MRYAGEKKISLRRNAIQIILEINHRAGRAKKEPLEGGGGRKKVVKKPGRRGLRAWVAKVSVTYVVCARKSRERARKRRQKRQSLPIEREMFRNVARRGARARTAYFEFAHLLLDLLSTFRHVRQIQQQTRQIFQRKT